MGNYCNGTVTFRGDRNVLERLNILTERLDECAAVSGFDADEDWIGHIFTEQVVDEGLFFEGGGLTGDTLEWYLRVSRSTGADTLQAMASSLNLEVEWVYVFDFDGREYREMFKPEKSLGWTLRTENSLDGDEEDDGVQTNPSSSQ